VESPPTGSSPARRPTRPRSRWWAVSAAGIVALVLSGCQLPSFGAFPGKTAQGQDAFKLYQGFFIAGIVIGGIVLVLIVWSVFRYRRRSESMPKQTQYHTLFEIAYTVIPIVVVLVMFGFTFATENNITAISDQPHVTVDVTAFQWGWEFQYPQFSNVKVIGVETQTPQMVLPAGVNVRIFLRSDDVIHGFYVPEFNYSMYAQPGRTNQFEINILHTGTYRGQCTQFCGLYHSLMFFSVKAVTPGQFQSWTQQQELAQSSSNASSSPARQNLGNQQQSQTSSSALAPSASTKAKGAVGD